MIILSSISQAGFAWGKDKKHKHGWGKDFTKCLDLTKKQEANISALKKSMKKEMVAFRKETKKIRLKMKNELQKDSPNKNLLIAYIKEINKKKTTMQIKRMDYILKIKSQLTPEQKKKFKTLFKNRKKGRKKK